MFALDFPSDLERRQEGNGAIRVGKRRARARQRLRQERRRAPLIVQDPHLAAKHIDELRQVLDPRVPKQLTDARHRVSPC